MDLLFFDCRILDPPNYHGASLKRARYNRASTW